MLKGMLSHAHGAVTVVADGQLGDALVLHVEDRRRPTARAIELKLERRGTRQVRDDTIANAPHTNGLARIIEKLLRGDHGKRVVASRSAQAGKHMLDCAKVPNARKLQALLPAERHVEALAQH